MTCRTMNIGKSFIIQKEKDFMIGNEYHLVTTIDLKSDYVFESDYYVDGTEYNLGLYIEKLKRETASEELFIENVLANGLIIQ